MSPAVPTGSPRSRLTSRSAAIAGGALILATLVAAGAFSRNEYLSQLRSQLTRSELQARVLEDHSTRSVESVSVLLASLIGQLDPEELTSGHLKTDALVS